MRLAGQLLAFAALLGLLAVLTAQPVNFSAVDLGRHLKNGELFVTQGTLVGTNFYSFTEPQLPVVNHHWLSGVLFYLVWKWLGFVGLHVAYLALHVLTIALFIIAALRRADWKLVFAITAALLPLLASRHEIRPEGLSYFALGLLMLWLTRLPDRAGSVLTLLAAVALLSVLWVNSHIFFFLGWVLTGAFLLQAFVEGGCAWRPLIDIRTLQGKLAAMLVTQIVASLVNPWGVQGVIEPFIILREYAYTVLENQPIPFILKRVGGGLYWHYVGVGVAALLLVLASLRRGLASVLSGVLLLVTFYALGFSAVRAMAMFAMIAIPCASVLASRVVPESARRVALGVAVVFLLAVVAVRGFYFSLSTWPHQLGLMPGSQGAGKFIRDTRLQGPIFNNYDVGGYFIFHLHPHYRPFVDNRPEAYSVPFLRDIYQGMLRDEQIWRREAQHHGFNAIFFYRHDATEHAQPFLLRRLDDPEWAPVWVDEFNIIFVRRTPQHERIIRDYELPRQMFSSRGG